MVKVDVWWAPAGVSDISHPLLSSRERTRLASITAPDARTESMSGAVLLRMAVAERASVRPADVRVSRTCPDCDRWHGRPELPDFPDLDVSVTHAGGVVGVAVVDAGRRVGIDLERIADAPNVLNPALLKLAAHPYERAALLHSDNVRRSFSTMWVRKEAATKLLGSGIRLPFSELDARRSPIPHDPPIWIQPLLRGNGHFAAALAADFDISTITISEHPSQLTQTDRN
ncbi:4'-phosphopantetheinyl transferase family protein [Curtobacterium poinsettiae]|uniref:4'-phosphopantetheinyl transferase family protein n=1 Tax=Curtobacterium poinsettiae TaxID=159612 RepID=UPI002877F4CE|nr:4'-phosphopantetheinyl transferase superfamily protein [Curtobacterium flaccumfaciens]